MKDWLVGLAAVIFSDLFGTWLFAPHNLQHWINQMFMD